MERLPRSAVVATVILAFLPSLSPGGEVDDDRWRCDRSPVLISGGSVWNGSGLAENLDILISAGRIQAIEETGRIEASSRVRRVDASGATVIPGLIDAHAHFFELGGPMNAELDGDPFEQAFRINGRQLVSSGVTNARVHLFDLHHGPELQKRSQDDCFPAPRLKIGGPGFIGGAPGLVARQVWGIESVQDGRDKVDRIAATEAEWIALHEVAAFEPNQARALVERARERGLKVMAGGKSPADVRVSLDLGVDSIEYLDLTPAASYPADILTTINTTSRPPTFVPPIGYYYRLESYRRDPATVSLGALAQLLPPEFSDPLLSGLRETLISDPYIDGVIAAFPSLRTKFEQLVASEAPVAIGTDCGSPGHLHHDAIWWEVATWKSLGVPMERTLRAATEIGSALLDAEDIGSIEVGRRADLVIYDGDLFQGLPEARRVRTVLKGGVVFVDRAAWVGPQ